jgi:hypothetical protein
VTPLQSSICTLVGNGMLLGEALDLPDMPSRSSIYRWLRESEEFAEEYALARERAADVIDEEIARMARSVTPSNATAVRTQLAALQWRASKLNPGRYGGAASIAIAATDDDVPAVDVAAARAKLLARFDEVAARIEAHEQDRFFVTRLIAGAVRDLEAAQRLDPSDEDDRALVLEAVRRAISPAFVLKVAVDGDTVPFAAAAAE